MFEKIKTNWKKRQKEKKAKESTKTILPFRKLEKNYIKTKTGVMDILQIKTRDLTSMNDNDLEYLFMIETKFLRIYPHAYKEVSLNFPTNTDKQQKYWEKIRSQTTSEVKLNYIDRKLFEFDYLERERSNREHFIFVYANTPDELKQRINLISAERENSFPLISISNQKKKDILFLMNNQNSKVIRKE